MRRHALLIGCPGEKDSFLPGVRKDIENYKDYLMSNNGGKWYENEITSIYGKSYSYINSVIRKIAFERYDVLVFVFSGHGNYSPQRECRRLYVDDTNFIYENEILNMSGKQITIIDTCAGIEHEPIFDSALNFSLEERSSYLVDYRKKYENAVNRCTPQSIKLYACDINEFSSDTSQGGLYSHNLIKLARDNIGDTLSALQVHVGAAEIVSRKTRNNKVSQNPQYECSVRMGPKLPFSLG